MNDKNDKNRQQQKSVDTEKVVEITANGAFQIFAAVTAPIPGLSGIGAMVLSVWQIEQMKKFSREVELKFESLEQSKLDQSVLKSDWYKEFIIRTIEEVLKNSSELKRQALASVLVNSVTLLSSKLFNKMALFRVLAQMSDEEMVVFTAIQEGFGHYPTFSCRTEDISAFLNWEYKKVVLVCKGLIQLDLLQSHESGSWQITEMGRRLISWWSGVDLPEGFDGLKRSLKTEVTEDVMRTLTRVFERA